MANHNFMLEMRRAIERERAKPPEHDFHDSTIAHLKECRAAAEDTGTRQVFDAQIQIQQQRKAEAIALKADSRRRNASSIG